MGLTQKRNIKGLEVDSYIDVITAKFENNLVPRVILVIGIYASKEAKEKDLGELEIKEIVLDLTNEDHKQLYEMIALEVYKTLQNTEDFETAELEE